MLGFAGEIGVPMPLLEAVIAVNDRMAEYVTQEIGDLEQTGRPVQVPAGLVAASVEEAAVEPTPQVVELPKQNSNGALV